MISYFAEKYTEKQINEIKRTTLFKETAYVWNEQGFNRSSRIGKCSQIAQDYLKITNEINLPSFEKYYYSRVNHKLFQKNVRQFKKTLNAAGLEIDYVSAYIFSFIRIIYDTFNGIVLKEKYLIDYLQTDENYVEHADEYTDRHFGIDLLVLNKYGFFEGVQVKPISFLKGLENFKRDVIFDFKTSILKEKQWLEKEENIKIVWLFYDGETIIQKSFSEMIQYFNIYRKVSYDYSN